MSDARLSPASGPDRISEIGTEVGGFRTMTARTPISVIVASCVLISLIILAVFAPLLASHDWTQQQIMSRLTPPDGISLEAKHILGADYLGRDVYSRLLYATRTTLVISSLGVCIGVLVGAAFGLISGLAPGWVDNVIMLVVDAN